jgi:alkanesulfonate monooxygenase SsuD/methylene tetrahydromethanopterin reductase-like flavin-dependent oxidoreductase (luciferase family)
MTRNDDELEILGLISTQYGSETHAPAGAVVDKSYVAALAAAHEHGNFDRVLIGYHSSAPDGFQVAAYDYYDLGITKFLFRGFDPLEDAIDYGRNLLPLFREAVAKRERPRVAAVG